MSLPPRQPGQTGRPRLTGTRLPMLSQVLVQATTPGSPVTVRRWDGALERVGELTSAPAVWDHSGMPPRPMRWVLVRDPQGKFAPQAWLCTDLTREPVPILAWFVRRGRLAVTGQEARAPLGLATPQPWNGWAMARPTPALRGLFSLVTLLAGPLTHEPALPVRQAVWYRTPLPTVADALAIVRRHLWTATPFDLSPAKTARVEIPGALLNRLTETLCYAA